VQVHRSPYVSWDLPRIILRFIATLPHASPHPYPRIGVGLLGVEGVGTPPLSPPMTSPRGGLQAITPQSFGGLKIPWTGKVIPFLVRSLHPPRPFGTALPPIGGHIPHFGASSPTSSPSWGHFPTIVLGTVGVAADPLQGIGSPPWAVGGVVTTGVVILCTPQLGGAYTLGACY